jgi:hypothetical protein
LDNFTWGGAWSAGYRAVAGRALQQAIILAGLGIIAPLAIQMTVAGTSMGIFGPASIGPASLSGDRAMVTPLLASPWSAICSRPRATSDRGGLRSP